MAAPAPAPAVPLALDVHADTLDHVVRAVARSGFLPEALRLMLGSPEHLHDPELLYRTRGVRGEHGTTLLMCAVVRCDVARAGEILAACPTPAARVELLALVDDEGFNALQLACAPQRLDEEAALRLVLLLLVNGADPQAPRRDPTSGRIRSRAIHFAATWSARLVQRLVQAGALIDGDVDGASTLLAAASAGTVQGVRMIPRLVALGARQTLGNEAMIVVAKYSDKGAQPTEDEAVAALAALVSVGCSVTQPDGEGLVPQDYAAHDSSVERALVSLGAPVATTNMLASSVKEPAKVHSLLAAGAPPDGLVPASYGGPL